MTKLSIATKLHTGLKKQRGAALLIMLVILVVGATGMMVSSLNSATLLSERNNITSQALAQAREALIGYAASVQISSDTSSDQPRPGELPCPDNHPLGDINEGSPSTPCNSNALGRLPWKKLGLPDLRDGSGERLWYALSTNFKNTNRTGTLNSDTVGTISVYSSTGTLINDATSNSGAVAVIIAPGEPLTRLDTGTMQDRSNAGYLTPSNYLDTPVSSPDPKDNASFADNSLDGFVQGMIKDINNKVILNDQLLVLTTDNIMSAVQKRVAGEVRNCLDDYAIRNNGRYPWAVQLNDMTYNDSSNLYFGRIPDILNSSNGSCGGGMGSPSSVWGPTCNTHQTNSPSTWWKNWREMVFYGLAAAYKPAPPLPAPTCGTCLTVTTSSATADKKFVVIVAGKMLPTQTNRPTNKSILSNYLEPPNSGGSTTFSQGAPSSTFNDTVIFKQ
jgi:hypothetical protein